MSDDTILQALDRMIASFKRDTPDEWAPVGTKDSQVPTKNASISAAVGTVGTEKQGSYAHARAREGVVASEADTLNFLEGSRESSIELSTGAYGAHKPVARACMRTTPTFRCPQCPQCPIPQKS